MLNKGICQKLENEDVKELELENYEDKAQIKNTKRKFKRIEKFVIKYIINNLNKYIILIANNKFDIKETSGSESSISYEKKNRLPMNYIMKNIVFS